MKFGSSPAPMPYESGVWGTPDNPCPSERTLAAHVDGELDAARAATLESHLDACPACASDHRRLEGLSGLLRGWDAQVGRPDVPPRLAARVLRDVTAEGGALRVETRRASRRSSLAAAAVVIVVVSAWLAGRISTESQGAVHRTDVAWARVAFPSDAAREPIAVPASVTASRLVPQLIVPALETGRERLLAALGTQDRDPSSSVYADGTALEAFAKWLPALDVERRLGEAVCLFDGRAIPTWALPEYERVRRLEGWIAARARRAIEADTRDPSATGKPVAEWLPFTDGSAVASFFHGGARRAVDRATPSHGGLLLRAIPGRASVGMGDSSKAGDDAGPKSLDLFSAQRAGRVRFLPDVAGEASGDRMEVAFEVSSATSGILVPTGELIAGGAGDRVVARGIWLPPSASTYLVRLPCRPLSRSAKSSETEGKGGGKVAPPTAFGRLAGPELRALLAVLGTGTAGSDDARAVLALVDAQLRDAAFPTPEDGRGSSLLELYRESDGVPSSAAARARELVDSLGEGAMGFVATDLDGRFQGLERVDLPPAAARATLERLVEGYLLEARSRSSADAPRLGVHAEALLGKLSERPVRLSPQRSTSPTTWSAEEPRTGLLLQGVPGEGEGIPLLSGHVPVFR